MTRKQYYLGLKEEIDWEGNLVEYFLHPGYNSGEDKHLDFLVRELNISFNNLNNYLESKCK